MGSLKDQLKQWQARGNAEAASLERAKTAARALPVRPPSVQSKPVKPNDAAPLPIQAATPKPRYATAQTQQESASFETSGFRPIGRSEHYRHPEAWVNLGSQLQAPGSTGGNSLTVRMGIDFGTAYTKVAISTVQNVFLVEWSGVTKSSERFFLPGVVSVLHGGAAFLGRCPTAARYLSDLKLPFLQGPSVDMKRHVAAAIFLAWVMKYARAWFYRNHEALCKGRTIIWEVNIGCPTDAWDDKSKVDLYVYIGHLAWRLSREEEIDELRGTAIGEELKQPFESEGLDALFVVPEFVAQIAGYVRSPQRREGLHILVDCGAGTVDVVTFNVHKNPDEHTDRYPIFSSKVQPLGGHFLMGKRAEVLGAGVWDDLELIPTREEIVEEFPDMAEALKQADERFEQEVAKVVSGVISHTKTMRTPLAQAWIDGLPRFLTGGGAASSVYSGAVSRAALATGVRVHAVDVPMPADTTGVTPADFHRMSVAYGLTYDRDSLGGIVPSKEIKDFLASTALRRKERPDRDDLYPK